jgi:5'-nucleotidase
VAAHLDAAAAVAAELVLRGFPELSSPYLLNVNIPNVPRVDIKGIRRARLGKRHSSSRDSMRDPHGRDIFWIGPPGGVLDGGEGTDFDVTSKNFVPSHLCKLI